VCAALPVLRRRTSGQQTFRLPAGQLFAALGVAFTALLAMGMGRTELYIRSATALLATLDWLYARRSGVASAFAAELPLARTSTEAE
jgi:hypothetical protein